MILTILLSVSTTLLLSGEFSDVTTGFEYDTLYVKDCNNNYWMYISEEIVSEVNSYEVIVQEDIVQEELEWIVFEGSTDTLFFNDTESEVDAFDSIYIDPNYHGGGIVWVEDNANAHIQQEKDAVDEEVIERYENFIGWVVVCCCVVLLILCVLFLSG
jgi:hypothetical protein